MKADDLKEHLLVCMCNNVRYTVYVMQCVCVSVAVCDVYVFGRVCKKDTTAVSSAPACLL